MEDKQKIQQGFQKTTIRLRRTSLNSCAAKTTLAYIFLIQNLYHQPSYVFVFLLIIFLRLV